MKLEVGEFYLSANGQIIIIETKAKADGVFYPYYGSNGISYTEEGRCQTQTERHFDLIAHIPKELHLKIIELVNSYHTNNVYKKAVNESFRINIMLK